MSNRELPEARGLSRREAERMLRDYGFKPGRKATHGTFWHYGDHKLMVQDQDRCSTRNQKNFLSDIARIMREVEQPTYPPQKQKEKEVIQMAEPIKPFKKMKNTMSMVDRVKLCEKIKQYKIANHTLERMVELAKTDGFRFSNGTDVDKTYIQRYAFGTDSAMTQVETPKPIEALKVMKKSGFLPDSCVAILTDPHLTDGQKVRMLTGFIEL